MKKFLSLVLAMIMALSLVTISAGAIEYADLTDTDEITYEEAVAVITKIGVLDGYEDGSFKPTNELTRGAAAKIIVGLLIGPEAANNLTVAAAPYPDVPVTNTFAAVISYCKTAGIISGYSDGTFKPTAPLTGYAFSKMLLGAIGYRKDIEGFDGTGWTMNVVKIGNAANLFDRLEFQGGDTVNRETAAQLALNTLKATMVEYSGGFSVTAGAATVVGAQNIGYVTSNQEYASHINNRKVSTTVGGDTTAWTVEFGEEHFKDLRLNEDGSAHDSFGRLANSWSWKKVTIGTFALQPDFYYDKLLEHKDASSAAKNRATGLAGYKTAANWDDDGDNVIEPHYTRVWFNGYLLNYPGNSANVADDATQLSVVTNTGTTKNGDLTDNGTVVYVYVSDTIADFITDVVVIQSQLMQVRKVGSDYVALEMYDGKASSDSGSSVHDFSGFNQNAINHKVANVQAEDDAYAIVSGLKADDLVVVIPVADNDVHVSSATASVQSKMNQTDSTWNVAEAYSPETVTGTLTAIDTYGNTSATNNVTTMTVSGTSYPVSLWNKDIYDVSGTDIKVTKTDVTLTLDQYGNAMLAEDVGATNNAMIVGAFRKGLENGRIVNYIIGWDISGTEVELNIGAKEPASSIKEGDLIYYESNATSSIADWDIYDTPAKGVHSIYNGLDPRYNKDTPYQIKASDQSAELMYYDNSATYKDAPFDKNVKFIYVTFDSDDEVESIEIKSSTNVTVTNPELLAAHKSPVTAGTYATKAGYNSAQAYVKSGTIRAVVIKQESNDATSTAMLYIRNYKGQAGIDADGKIVYGYTVAMNTPDGLEDDVTIYSNELLQIGDFASYAEKEHGEFNPFYKLRNSNDISQKTTPTFGVTLDKIMNSRAGYVYLYNNGTQGYALAPTVNAPKYDSYRTIRSATTFVAKKPNISTVSTATWDDEKIALGSGDYNDVVQITDKTVFVDVSGNHIDSRDDLFDFMYTDPDKNEIVSTRQNVVYAKVVVNDNPTSDYFRQVSMIIIEGSDHYVLANEDYDTPWLKTATINGEDVTNGKTVTVKAGGKETIDITAKFTASSGGYITVTPNSNLTSVSYTPDNGTANIITVKGKLAANATATFTVAVASKKGTTGNSWTVAVTATDDYSNPVAKSSTYSGLDTVTESVYSGSTAAAEIKIDSGVFKFPYLATGDASETIQQLNAAITYWNGLKTTPADQKIDLVPTGTSAPSDGVWALTYTDRPGTPLTFSEANYCGIYVIKEAAKIVVPVGTTPSGGKAVSDLSFTSGASGYASETVTVGDSEVTRAVDTSRALVAGATYKAAQYIKVVTPTAVTKKSSGSETGLDTLTFKWDKDLVDVYTTTGNNKVANTKAIAVAAEAGTIKLTITVGATALVTKADGSGNPRMEITTSATMAGVATYNGASGSAAQDSGTDPKYVQLAKDAKGVLEDSTFTFSFQIPARETSSGYTNAIEATAIEWNDGTDSN